MEERADGGISWRNWSQWTGKSSHPKPSQGATAEREARTTGQWVCTELCLQYSGLQSFEGDWVKIHNCGPPQCVQWHQCPHHTCIKGTLMFKVPTAIKLHREPAAWHKSSLLPQGMLCGMRSCGGTGEHEPQWGSVVLPQVREQTLMQSKLFCLWCGAWKWSSLLCVGLISMTECSSLHV